MLKGSHQKRNMKVNEGIFSKIENWRIKFIYYLIVAIFGFYILRLFNLQILQNDAYLEQAEENRTTNISVQTERGIVLF